MKKSIETDFVVGSGKTIFLKELTFKFKNPFVDIYNTKVKIEDLKTYISKENKIIFRGKIICDVAVKELCSKDTKDDDINLNGKVYYKRKAEPFSGFLTIDLEDIKFKDIKEGDKVEVTSIKVVDQIIEKINGSEVFENCDLPSIKKFLKLKDIICIKLELSVLREGIAIIDAINSLDPL